MSEYKFLNYSQDNGFGLLELNREEKLNALNKEVILELLDFFTKLQEKKLDSVRGILFTGAGEKAFIAGADISAMSSMTPEQGEEFARLGQSLTLAIENSPFPIIAGVQGYALGGGCEMALSCDFILATENAIFGLPEVSLGLIPGFGGTQRLSRVIGRNKAKEVIYSARMIKAEESLSLGISLKILPNKEQLIDYAKGLIKQISKNSPLAVAKAKEALNNGVDLELSQGLNCEAKTFGTIFSSYDMKEGTTAFVEKRKAEFKGN